jgi:hypothetical protein
MLHQAEICIGEIAESAELFTASTLVLALVESSEFLPCEPSYFASAGSDDPLPPVAGLVKARRR